MPCSLLTISKDMDSVEAPKSMRELAKRHRWLGGAPPHALSLRSVCKRHTAQPHRTLWYNTYLIHGMQLSLCNLIQIGRMLPFLGEEFRKWFLNNSILPEELIDMFDITTDMLDKAFGLSKDALVKTFPGIVDSFIESIPGVGWVVKKVKKSVSDVTKGQILGKLSPYDLVANFPEMTPDQIVQRCGLDFGKIAAAFCDRWVKALSEWTGYSLDATVDIKGDAPQRPMRAREIGKMIGAQYDVAGLCEVFERERQDDVIAKAGESGRPAQGHRGPEADGELAGSGLLTITFGDASSVESARSQIKDALGNIFQPHDLLSLSGGSKDANTHVFSNQGSRLHDADAWSRKGVLRTVVDLGVGRLDLYTTHLYKGGDGLGEPSDEERWAVKQSQIGEIVAFMTQTHDSRNVAMLMGDFNVGATDVTEYGFLTSQLAKVHLVDLWPFWMEPPAGIALAKPGGATDNPSRCADFDKSFCGEPTVPQSGTVPPGQRIDYVFVERPRPQHSFTLDFGRMRRRAFHFPEADDEFLSDHVGLHFLMFAST